jgi:hypothetical protein
MKRSDLNRVIIFDAGEDEYEVSMKDLVEALLKEGFAVTKIEDKRV